FFWIDLFNGDLLKYHQQALEALKEFKSKFPKTSIKAGTSMILTKQKDVIENPWLAKSLFMSYLAANNPISKEAKESIAEGFEKILVND
ncbi:18665_t:CDS:2, partial [Acaulospora morrowiae]